MSTLNAICTGLATTIRNYVETPIYAYDHMADVVNYPAIVCEPVQPAISYAGSFAAHQSTSEFGGSFGPGTDMWHVGCYVLMPADGSAQPQQNLLNQFLTGCGPNSVRQILHEHGDIGLADTTAVAIGVSKYGATWEWGAVRCTGAMVTVRVITDASDANPYETN
jgi:hypothetical protein